jgi:hypothetical protein
MPTTTAETLSLHNPVTAGQAGSLRGPQCTAHQQKPARSVDFPFLPTPKRARTDETIEPRAAPQGIARPLLREPWTLPAGSPIAPPRDSEQVDKGLDGGAGALKQAKGCLWAGPANSGTWGRTSGAGASLVWLTSPGRFDSGGAGLDSFERGAARTWAHSTPAYGWSADNVPDKADGKVDGSGGDCTGVDTHTGCSGAGRAKTLEQFVATQGDTAGRAAAAGKATAAGLGRGSRAGLFQVDDDYVRFASELPMPDLLCRSAFVAPAKSTRKREGGAWLSPQPWLSQWRPPGPTAPQKAEAGWGMAAEISSGPQQQVVLGTSRAGVLWPDERQLAEQASRPGGSALASALLTAPGNPEVPASALTWNFLEPYPKNCSKSQEREESVRQAVLPVRPVALNLAMPWREDNATSKKPGPAKATARLGGGACKSTCAASNTAPSAMEEGTGYTHCLQCCKTNAILADDGRPAAGTGHGAETEAAAIEQCLKKLGLVMYQDLMLREGWDSVEVRCLGGLGVGMGMGELDEGMSCSV